MARTIRKVMKVVTPDDIMQARKKQNDRVQVVEIEWTDAVSVGGIDWVHEEDVDLNAAPSFALGYLIGETASTYTLVSLVNESHYAHGITIPKGMVVEVRRLA